MKIREIIQLSICSLILMIYGAYLWQTNVSMLDLAGILMFITGAISLVLSFIIHAFIKKYSWGNKWFINILTSALSCVIIFSLIVVYSRLNV